MSSRPPFLFAVLAAGVVALWQCGSSDRPRTDPAEHVPEALAPRPTARASEAITAWNTVYKVLQHPRCSNCHPAGDVPLQGDDARPHGQNVQRGEDGTGRYALRCGDCHQGQNLTLPDLPPGAPHWQMPRRDLPLQFAGLGTRELCQQLRDPARNGGRTPAQLLQHMASDPLVLWGWSPGPGRTPVPIPHEQLVNAMRTWVDGGCSCPDR